MTTSAARFAAGAVALAALPPEMSQRARDFFLVTAEILPLAASGSGADTISINDDADFLIVAGTGVVTSVDNATFLANVPILVELKDSGSGRDMMDAPVHWNNIFGTAQYPAIWPYPKLIRRASSLTVKCTNLEATARNVRVTFHGFKVFGFNR